MMIIVKVETLQQIAGGYREFHEIGDIRGLLPDMVKKMLEAVRLDTSQAPTLAILPFSIPVTGVSVQDAEVLVQLLAIELANSGKYAVLPRTKTIETALAMVETLRSELPDLNSINAIGKAINAQCVLTGNVMRLGGNLNVLVAQILTIETASLRAGGDVEYRTITDGFQLIPELAFQLTGVPAGMPSISIPENMVWVAGGAFQMGNTKGAADEAPVHTGQVSSLFMGKTPVTQKEYEAVMGKNPSSFKGADLPVENVTWYDAVEYCNKLSMKEGLIPAYSGSNDNITCNFTANGYRLPTEAEWEYAARGGNRDTLAFDYAGGNSIDVLGWYEGNSEAASHAVGQKQPNSLGLYDMAGNVWEWCWDWYGPYQQGNQRDPWGPALGKERVNRGGGWSNKASYLRSTYRSVGNPGNRYRDLGFRVLRPIL
jgi:formylglycine-generating enzyme required for sulfatase activity